jgi:hypothetical protein
VRHTSQPTSLAAHADEDGIDANDLLSGNWDGRSW